MSKLRVTGGAVLDYSEDGWTVFKKWLDGTLAKLRYTWTDEGNSYTIVAADGPFYRTFSINKVDASEFESRFKTDIHVGNPQEQDGKQVVVISPATEGLKTWVTSRGDDLGLGAAGRGLGQQMSVSFSDTDPADTSKYVDIQWLEVVEVNDGQLNWDPAYFDGSDEFSVSVILPACTATSTPGTGNVNEVPLGGGFSIYVPAANDGTHTIDLNDYAKACPQPSSDHTGYWDVDDDGVITPAVLPGQGEYHLTNLEAEVFLISCVSMKNSLGLFDVDIYKTEWIHPAWKIRMRVTKATPANCSANGWLLCFRRNISRT